MQQPMLAQSAWVHAEDLQSGQLVALADGSVKQIQKINVLSMAASVFNFEVEEVHTYYVSTDGVLVHNTDCEKLKKLKEDERAQADIVRHNENKISEAENRLDEMRKDFKKLMEALVDKPLTPSRLEKIDKAERIIKAQERYVQDNKELAKFANRKLELIRRKIKDLESGDNVN